MGQIHSIESMGLNDGPGIRTVVFFQGCRLRCIYCHNPDTIPFNKGMEITLEQLINKIIRFKPYFETSNGGVTCSGGEPLLQAEFLIEFLKLCKKNHIHTTLDTTGFGVGRYDEILKYTDLVLLDIKHVNHRGYRHICNGDFRELEIFIEELNRFHIDIWVRHVVVPGLTDNEEHIKKLNEIINTIDNVKKVELLPYHTLGVHKYKSMNMEYKLAGIKDMDREIVRRLEKKVIIDNYSK
ncbi:MAG: pyruvate formate lyase-activating protein [Clostridiales bacterium]|nr:pyruvate formate lyase-activating protein [Clostridiales bacterium]